MRVVQKSCFISTRRSGTPGAPGVEQGHASVDTRTVTASALGPVRRPHTHCTGPDDKEVGRVAQIIRLHGLWRNDVQTHWSLLSLTWWSNQLNLILSLRNLPVCHERLNYVAQVRFAGERCSCPMIMRSGNAAISGGDGRRDRRPPRTKSTDAASHVAAKLGHSVWLACGPVDRPERSLTGNGIRLPSWHGVVSSLS